MPEAITICTTTAELCRVAASKSRTMPDMVQWEAPFEQCAQACDRAAASMTSGSHADCPACAKACEDIAAEMRIYDYQFTEDARKSCAQCAEVCGEMGKIDA